MSKEKGIKKFDQNYLKSNGIDPHEIKRDFRCKPVSHYDLYDGETVTIRDKSGKLFKDTELTTSQFFDYYAQSRRCEI